VNFAARLQGLAAPYSVLMSEATHRLVEGMVDAAFSGEHQIKGKAQAQKVYRLKAARQGMLRTERPHGVFSGKRTIRLLYSRFVSRVMPPTRPTETWLLSGPVCQSLR
jgi:hypothetical protein